MGKRPAHSVDTPMKMKARTHRLSWIPPLLVLIGAIMLPIPPHALSSTAPEEPSESYQLAPSWWEGLISREGKTYYPLILVIEEVYPDHSFIGHMKWNPNGRDIVAIEGSAEGSHLTFVDTVMLTGWPGNITRIKRNVIITGNRMTGTNTNLPGVVTLTAERQPLDGQITPEYTAKAMKADFQRWKTEVDMCRQAKHERQQQACWQSLALQTHVQVFCNEVSNFNNCKEKVLDRTETQPRLSVAARLAQVIQSFEEPDLEVFVKEAEALVGQISAVHGAARWEAIKQSSLAVTKLEQAVRRSDPMRHEAFKERLHNLSVAYAPFIEPLSEEERFLLAMYTMATVHTGKDRAAEQACGDGDAQACAVAGASQYRKGQWTEVRDSLSKACEGKNERGCFGLAILEAVNGDQRKARKDFQTLCTTRSAYTISSCSKLDRIVSALSGDHNLAHAPAPDKLQEVLPLPFMLVNSADEGQRLVGEGMASLLGMNRPVEFEKADLLFAEAASRGVDVFRLQSEVASELLKARTQTQFSGMQVWAEMKSSLLNQRICAWHKLSEFQHHTTCTYLFKEL